MAWRDSFVAMPTAYRQSTASTETDLSGRSLPQPPTTTEDDDDDNLDSADFLLSVERRVKALRRNTQNDFVLRGDDENQVLKFRSALQEIAQLQQKCDNDKLHTYVEEDLPNMRDFFALQREDSTNEVFTDNPLLEESHRQTMLHAPNSQSFRNILKKTHSPSTAAMYVSGGGEATWKNPLFQDKVQALKTGDEDDEDTVDKFKRRMSGLGKSLKKTLSFRKQ